MATVTTTSSAAARRKTPALGFVRLVPGLVLLFVTGFAGKLVEQAIASYGKAHHLALPNIEYVLWAIIFGLIIANTVGVPEPFRAGVETYDFWLKTGIVLQGARFLLGDMLKLGGASLACVAIELALGLVLMTALGRSFNLSAETRSACWRSDLPSAACRRSSPPKAQSTLTMRTRRTRWPPFSRSAP